MFQYYFNFNLITYMSSAIDLLVTADIGLNMLKMMFRYVVCTHGIFGTDVFVSSFVFVDNLIDAGTSGVLQ